PTRSTSWSKKAAMRCGSSLMAGGSATRPTTTYSGRKPMSTSRRFRKLRRRSPAPTSSISESANWEPTNAWLSLRVPAPRLPRASVQGLGEVETGGAQRGHEAEEDGRGHGQEDGGEHAPRLERDGVHMDHALRHDAADHAYGRVRERETDRGPARREKQALD